VLLLFGIEYGSDPAEISVIMAESEHSNATGTLQETTLGNSSRMSLVTIQSRAPNVVAAPSSPTHSVHPFLEPPSEKGTLDPSDASHRSRVPSCVPSSVSASSQVSTTPLKSPRGRTSSEEKEVILTRDGKPSAISKSTPVSPIKDDNGDGDAFMRAIRTRLGSVGGPDAFAPSPTRAQAASSAALELANARRVSKLLTGNDSIGPGLDSDRESQENSPEPKTAKEYMEEENIQADLQESPVVIAAAEQAQINRAQSIYHRPSVRRTNSKAARALSGDREAAIQEQGGIVLPPHAESPEPAPPSPSKGVKKSSIKKSPGTSPTALEMDNLTAPIRPERPRRSLTLEDEQADSVADLGAAPSATRRFSIFDALRSNPPDMAMIPKRAATAPTRRQRKPTFTEDASLDLQAAKRFSRENVVSTPYPATEGAKEKRFEKARAEGAQKEKRFEKLRAWREGEGYEGLRRELKKGENRTCGDAGPAVTVMVYSRGQAAPAVGPVVIPMSAPSSLSSRSAPAVLVFPPPHANLPPREPEHEQRSAESADPLVPAPRAKGKLVKKTNRFKVVAPPLPPPAPFDDEKLARALRAEYRHLRGPLRVCLGARTLQGIRILRYTYLSSLSLPETAQNPFHPQTLPSDDQDAGAGDGNGGRGAGQGGSIQRHLQTLVRCPRTGRGKTTAVDFLRAHALKIQAAGSGADSEPREKIALCFQENWSAARLAVAFGVTLGLSVLATLLWVFLGAGADVHSGAMLGQIGGVIKTSVGGISPSEGGGGGLETAARGDGAAGRVQGGVVMGLLVLLLGWTGMAGWVAVSWLVM